MLVQWNRFKARDAFARVSVNIELGKLLHAAICEGCQKQTHNAFPIPTAGKQGQMLKNILSIPLYKQVHTTGRNCCVITATQIKANDVIQFMFRYNED